MRDNNHVPDDLRKFCELGGMACPVSNFSRNTQMKIHHVSLARRGILWSCETEITIVTAAQFTSEWHMTMGQSRCWIVAVARSYWTAWRLHRKLRAKPGERAAKGWIE